MQMSSPKCLKVLQMCSIYLCFFFLGMCLALPGPCRLHLQLLVQSDIPHMVSMDAGRSAGYVFGAIFGGVLLDAIKSKQALLSVFLLIDACAMLGVPWTRSLIGLTACMAVSGFAAGFLDTGCSTICLSLSVWGRDNGPFLQALHFCFGLGASVSPLVASPFLHDLSREERSYTSTDGTGSEVPTNLITGFRVYNHSYNTTTPSIVYPFSIVGGFGLMVALVFLAVAVLSPLEEKPETSKDSSQGPSKRSPEFLFLVVLLSFLFILLESGIELGYSQMLTTYAVKSALRLSPTAGSFMTSAFWTSLTVSRLASIFLAMRLSGFSLIVLDLGISLIGSLILLVWASHEWAAWLASVLLGAGLATFLPSSITWADAYIDVTNKVLSVFEVGAVAGQVVVMFAISYFMQSAPGVLAYVVLAACIAASSVPLALYLILRKAEKKETHKEESECPEAKGESLNTVDYGAIRPNVAEGQAG